MYVGQLLWHISIIHTLHGSVSCSHVTYVMQLLAVSPPMPMCSCYYTTYRESPLQSYQCCNKYVYTFSFMYNSLHFRNIHVNMYMYLATCRWEFWETLLHCPQYQIVWFTSYHNNYAFKQYVDKCIVGQKWTLQKYHVLLCTSFQQSYVPYMMYFHKDYLQVNDYNLYSQLQRTGDSAQKCAIDEWDCYFYEFESTADLVWQYVHAFQIHWALKLMWMNYRTMCSALVYPTNWMSLMYMYVWLLDVNMVIISV